jgi:hypothetical protein
MFAEVRYRSTSRASQLAELPHKTHFVMRFPGQADMSLNSGSISGVSLDTTYFVFYDDPGLIGQSNGPVQYHASTVKEDAIGNAARFYVGSIRTPKPGAPDTIGAGDGGTGSQYGMTNILSFSVNNVSLGSFTNLSNFNDGDITTFATGTINAAANNELISFGVFTQGRRFQSYTLKIRWAVPVFSYVTSPGVPVVKIIYQTPAGQFLIAQILSGGSPQAPTTSSVSLPFNVNFSSNLTFQLVIFQGPVGGAGVGEQCTIQLYEAWIEGVE